MPGGGLSASNVTAAAILYGIVVPAGVATLTLLSLWRPWSRRTESPAAWAAGAAAALAYAASHPLLLGRAPRFPPSDVADWTFFGAIALAALSALEAWEPLRSAWWQWPARFVAAVALPSLLLRPLIEYEWSAGEATAWIASVSACLMIAAALLDAAARRAPAAAMGATLWVIASSAAVVLMLGGSASLAQRAGTIATAGAAAGILGLWATGRRMSLAAVTTVVVLLGSLMVEGAAYARASWLAGGVLAAAPSGLLAAFHPPLTKWPRTARVAAAIAALLTACAAAIVIGWILRPASDSYDYYG